MPYAHAHALLLHPLCLCGYGLWPIYALYPKFKFKSQATASRPRALSQLSTRETHVASADKQTPVKEELTPCQKK
jgi:hypothetical protein